MSKTCTTCEATKEISGFRFLKSKGRYLAECLICESQRKKDYKTRNKDKMREANRIWQLANPERMKAAQERWKAKNPTLAKQRANEWYVINKVMVRARERGRYHELKKIVYDAYGAICVWCSDDYYSSLTVDHVNNDGNIRRKEIGYGVGRNGGGIKLYKQIIAEGFPPTYQILCMRCNWEKSRNGGVLLPHRFREGSTTIPQGSTSQAIGDGSAQPQQWVKI